MTRHAPHDTRLGRLQRGHGQGFREALEHPGPARDELLQCILRDPRIDAQVESRSRYYAELAVRLGVRGAPVVEFALARPDDWLAVDVLAEMAARGDHDAAALLIDPTDDPEVSARMLEYLCDYPAWTGANVSLATVGVLAAHLHERGELVTHVDVYGEFWKPWSHKLPLVAAAILDGAAAHAAAVAMAPPVVDDPAALSLDGLLATFAGEASDRLTRELLRRNSSGDRDRLAAAVAGDSPFGSMRGAACALADMGDLRLLDLAERLFAAPDDYTDPTRTLSAVDRRRRLALLWYFTALPAIVTLPLARRWWRRGGYSRLAAGRVLALHADPADREWLEGAVTESLHRGTGEDVIDEIRALSHLGDPRSVPVLQTIAERAQYSYARTRALGGLVDHAHLASAGEQLTAALWDCEEEARRLACERATVTDPGARHRVHELAHDIIEDDTVRNAAAARAVDAA